MLLAALLVALFSLWIVWPGVRRKEGVTALGYALRWMLFGMLSGSTFLLVYLLLGS